MRILPTPPTRLGRFLLVIWGLAGLATFAVAQSPAKSTAQSTLDGIDISHHSGAIDWNQIRASGVDFVYIKATEGVDLPDPMFQANWQASRGAGIPRGAYHFYVTEDDPIEQAHFFLNQVHHRVGDLIPVVDIEVLGTGTQPGLTSRVRQFLEQVEEELGVRPMIYTSANFWDSHFEGSFGEYPLWIAEYEVDAPRLPNGWTEWTLWQWAEDQVLAGAEKGVDRSSLAPSRSSVESLKIPHRKVAPVQPDET